MRTILNIIIMLKNYKISRNELFDKQFICIFALNNNVMNKKQLTSSFKQAFSKDVENWKNFVWIECSCAIEHLWENAGGIKIPSAYLPLFIDEKMLQNVSPVQDNPYTYFRTVTVGTEDKIRIEKRIYGFSNREVMEKYIKDKNTTLEKLCQQYNVDPETIVNESFKYREAPRHLWPYLKILRYFYEEFKRGRLELTSE